MLRSHSLLSAAAAAALLVFARPAAGEGPSILMDDIDQWRAEFYCGNPAVRGFVQGPKEQTALSGIVDFDSQGNGYVAAGDIVAVVATNGEARVLTGQQGITGSADGPSGVALFGHAIDLALDGDGRIYVADAANLTLRLIERDRAGIWHTTTVAGMPGRQGHRDGPGRQALFMSVFDSVTVDPATRIVYLFDGDWLRKFDHGVVTTLNPDGGSGYENGALRRARFAHSQGRAHGLTTDGKGFLYVADKVNMAIRRVDLAKASIDTIAGVLPGQPKERPRDALNALDARFHPGGGPNMIFYNAPLDALICRSDDETVIRIIKDGAMKTFGPGVARGKEYTGPWKTAVSGVPCGVDRAGNVYVMGGNCIRRIVRPQGGAK